MSSIIACRLPFPWSSMPSTRRGVLSSDVSPIDWASRRAGSTVSTQTCLPRSAARSPIAAAVVVLPTPPEPQQTMIRVRRSSMIRSMSRRGFWVFNEFPLPARGSRRALVAEFRGQLVQGGQIDPLGHQRQFVDRLASRLKLGPLPVGQLDQPRVLADLLGQGGGEGVRVV